MSTKTIAVESGVYRRLSAAKREGESFSNAISRLLDEVDQAHTGRDIAERLGSIPDLGSDAEAFYRVIRGNRQTETWQHDAVR